MGEKLKNFQVNIWIYISFFNESIIFETSWKNCCKMAHFEPYLLLQQCFQEFSAADQSKHMWQRVKHMHNLLAYGMCKHNIKTHLN